MKESTYNSGGSIETTFSGTQFEVEIAVAKWEREYANGGYQGHVGKPYISDNGDFTVKCSRWSNCD